MGIWILATVIYGNLLGSALLFSPQNCQHKITQNRVCNAFWWMFEWFSVIVITLEHVGHISVRSNPICSRSDLASRKSSYPLSQRYIPEVYESTGAVSRKNRHQLQGSLQSRCNSQNHWFLLFFRSLSGSNFIIPIFPDILDMIFESAVKFYMGVGTSDIS